MTPKVIVFTWLRSVGEMIEEELRKEGIREVVRTTWTLDALNQARTFHRSDSDMVVIIDRGAFESRVWETNRLTQSIREIAPHVRVVRIGSRDDFPPSAKGDKFWPKYGYDFERLGGMVRDLLEHAHA